MKVCSTRVGVFGSILRGFWVFLCTFLKAQMAFERFSFSSLSTFLFVSGPFLAFWGLQRAIFGIKMGSFWEDLDHFWVDPASFWGHSVIVLSSFGPHFGSFWCRFDHGLGIFWAHFWAIFTVILRFFVMFWEVGYKIRRRKKICNFLPKFTKIMQNCAKTCPFSPLKTLVLIKKNPVKIDVSTYESVQYAGRCVWKYPAWILSVFMHFSEGADGFWTVFFFVIIDIFVRFWAIFGLLGATKGHFWDQNGVILGGFGPFLGRSGVILGPLSDRVVIVWVSFWVVLVSFWPRFGSFWFLFWGHFYGHFAVLGDVLGKLDAKLSEGKIYAIFCQSSPKLCKIVQIHALFRL